MGDVVLMVFAYALNEINEKWVMKIETNKLMSIRKNVEYLGTNVSIKFPQIHTVTGCDTTSFLHSDVKRKAHTSKHNWCFLQSFRHNS